MRGDDRKERMERHGEPGLSRAVVSLFGPRHRDVRAKTRRLGLQRPDRLERPTMTTTGRHGTGLQQGNGRSFCDIKGGWGGACGIEDSMPNFADAMEAGGKSDAQRARRSSREGDLNA